MLTLLEGGHVIDPANMRDGIGDVWMQDGRVVAPPASRTPDQSFDAAGKIVMAGGIDIHSHIAGGNVNTARLLLPEAHRAHVARPAHTPLATAGWSTFETGTLYAQMGFSLVVEPAVAPHHALHAHLELADIPIIDKAILTVLGNDDFLLGFLRAGESKSAIRDYVAVTLASTRGLGVKVINAGGGARSAERDILGRATSVVAAAVVGRESLSETAARRMSASVMAMVFGFGNATAGV